MITSEIQQIEIQLEQERPQPKQEQIIKYTYDNRLPKDPLLLGTLEIGQDLSIEESKLTELKRLYGFYVTKFITRMMRRFDFSAASIDRKDLQQCADILLIIAWKNYKENKGAKFLTFYVWYLINGFRGIITKRRVPLIMVPEIIEEKGPKRGYNHIAGLGLPVHSHNSIYDDLRKRLAFCVETLQRDGHLADDEIVLLNMRKAGYMFWEIGDKMGFTRERARQIFDKVVEKIKRRDELLKYEEEGYLS